MRRAKAKISRRIVALLGIELYLAGEGLGVRIIAAWALAFTLGSCANEAAQEQAAQEQAKQQAIEAYKNCLEAAVVQLDDGKSDTLTVAYAVKASCGQQFLAWRKAASASLTPAYQALFLSEDTNSLQLDSAMSAVSLHRTRRVPPTASPPAGVKP